MKIILLGTACAQGGKDRDNTSLLIDHDNELTIIDVSGNPMGKLKNLNYESSQIKDVILTHFHIDHIYGLPSLLWGMWIENRIEPLTIHCSISNENKLKEWLDHIDIKSWKINFKINIKCFLWNVENTLIVKEAYTMSSFPAVHGVENIGVNISYNNKRVVYSSDTELNESIKKMKGVDILIHESTNAKVSTPGHSSLLDIVNFYSMDHIKSLVLVHLTDDEPYNQVINDLLPEDKEKIKIGYDGMVLYP